MGALQGNEEARRQASAFPEWVWHVVAPAVTLPPSFPRPVTSPFPVEPGWTCTILPIMHAMLKDGVIMQGEAQGEPRVIVSPQEGPQLL